MIIMFISYLTLIQPYFIHLSYHVHQIGPKRICVWIKHFSRERDRSQALKLKSTRENNIQVCRQLGSQGNKWRKRTTKIFDTYHLPKKKPNFTMTSATWFALWKMWDQWIELANWSIRQALGRVKKSKLKIGSNLVVQTRPA